MKYTQEQAEYFMNEALLEAKQAEQLDEIPIGCVIVKDGKIIGRGYNYREHSNLACDHAEIMAITAANKKLNSWRLEQCSLFVTLEPCPMCSGAIINSRIEEVYYGAADLKAGMAGSIENILNEPRLNHQVVIQKGILEDHCRTVLQNFFRKTRKK